MLPKTFVSGFHDEEAVRKMKYSKLGDTDLEVSFLGLGGGAYSRLYGKFDEEEAIANIQEAIRKGINYIDTAFWYGQGQSEEILGKALKGVPRKAYYIATKVGRYYLDPKTMFDFSAETTRNSLERSLRNLGVGYLDIIKVHDIEFAPNLEYVFTQTLPVLQEAIKEGKARYLGVTGYPVSILQRAVESSPIKIHVVLSYCRNTLIDDSLSEIIPSLQKKGVGVISATATAMGLLSNAGPPDWHPATNEIKMVCREAAKYCKELDVELGKLAVYHSLKKDGVAMHVVGMNTMDLLNSNLNIVYNGITAHEKRVLEHVKEKFFSRLREGHWEGLELKRYNEITAAEDS